MFVGSSLIKPLPLHLLAKGKERRNFRIILSFGVITNVERQDMFES
jgi:hypothetical protein